MTSDSLLTVIALTPKFSVKMQIPTSNELRKASMEAYLVHKKTNFFSYAMWLQFCFIGLG